MNKNNSLEQLRREGREIAPLLKKGSTEKKQRLLEAMKVASIFLDGPEGDEKAG